MPNVFRHPHSKAAAGKTIYVAPIGPSSVIGAKPTQIRDIKDGTSNTILIVEAADDAAVYWTKPADLPIDVQQPLKGLGNFPPGTFQAAMADGSVRALSRTINARLLNALFTKDGGEEIPDR
jgi:hypothetical protein